MTIHTYGDHTPADALNISWDICSPAVGEYPPTEMGKTFRCMA